MKILDRFVDRVTKKGIQTVKEEAKKTVEEAINENEQILAVGAAALTAIAVYRAMHNKPVTQDYAVPISFVVW